MATKARSFLFVFASALIYLGCEQPSSPVGMVKNGLLPGYTAMTVGTAFDQTFQNGKWTSFQNDEGTLVEFTGTVKGSALDKAQFNIYPLIENSAEYQKCAAKSQNFKPCVENVTNHLVVPVRFQFLVNLDRRTFDLRFVDLKPFTKYQPNNELNSRDAALAFVYR